MLKRLKVSKLDIWVKSDQEIEYQHPAWSNFVRACFETEEGNGSGDLSWIDDTLRTEYQAVLNPITWEVEFPDETQLTLFLLRWA